MQILVKAPAKTKEVMLALRDWQPEKDVRFTLDRRKSMMLVFNVTATSGYQAMDLAKKRLKELKLDELTGLEIAVLD